jgi:hypothetical protein
MCWMRYIYKFIQFFTTSATTSNSNLEKELHQRNSIPMIVKIIGARYKGQKQKE